MKNLRTLRESKNMTQKELAKALNISQQTISSYEGLRREADYETQNKIANYFDVSVDYLLGRVDDPSLRIVKKELLPDDLAPYVDYIEILKDYDLSDLSPEGFRMLIEAAKSFNKQVNQD